MPLFKTIAEVAAVVPVMQSFDIELVLPDIERAETRWLIDVVGQAQFDNINTPYQAGTSLNTAQTNLLKKMRVPVAHLAYYLYAPKGNVNVGSSGIQQTHSEGSSKPAFQWAVDEMRKGYLDGGYDALDVLAEFLEANKATYTIWAASSAYAKSKELFVNSTKEFNAEFAINNSRMLFMAMRHILKRHDNSTIKKVIGENLFDEIKQQIYDDAVSDANEILLSYIRPALVNLTVMDAIPEIGLKMDEFGITVVSPQRTGSQSQSVSPANSDQLNSLWKKVKQVGEDYLAGLKDYLQANSGTYPLYTATENFTKTYKNNQDSGIAFL